MVSAVLTSQHAVPASVYHLERNDLWKKEKPFFLDYTPVPPAIKSNAVIKPQDVVIEDIRGNENNFTYDRNGFCMLPVDDGMSAEDFDDEKKIRELYLPYVAEVVKQNLGASRVQIYDYLIRKRNSTFPMSTGEYYAHKQPASIAHVDLTPECMAQMLLTMNGLETSELMKKHHQSVNIWKPLRGPIHDWPLALCDPRSMSAFDLQPRDTVKRDNFIETYQVHHNRSHKWYYLSGQMPNEAWVFLQADSSPQGMTGVPHAAFQNPVSSPNDIPRESIEVRCIAFFDDDD
ncbi:unnamed protein product [Alternaria alternata]